LDNACDFYTNSGLWEYDFKILFSTDPNGNYLRIPLVTFTENSVSDTGFDVCNIYVEQLNSTNADSQQILFGSMFF